MQSGLLKEPTLVTEQKWDKDVIPLVSISCITYNHEKYIRDAIEGFLMQKTTFPVEILIHDDASTDKTPEIIREYEKKFPNLIFPIFQKENQYSKGIFIPAAFQYPRARGKYYGGAEGDDYWTDPYKLQKQVSFLERNSNYNVCVGGFVKYDENTKTYEEIIRIPPGIVTEKKGYTFTLNETKKAWITKTLTVLFRNDKEILNHLSSYKNSRDISLFYHLLKNDKLGFYFTEVMGVYRMHYGGIHSLKTLRERKTDAYNIYKELYEKNIDDYTRYMNFHHTIRLLKFNLANKYQGNNAKTNLKLLNEAIFLSRNLKEIRSCLKVLVIR